MTKEAIITDKLKVTVWPNPSENEFTLLVQSNSDETIDVRVYDVVGRIVEHIEKSNGSLIMFGNKLKTGVYIAEVRQGNKRQTVKLFKNH